jgi:hypothetical protein
MYHKEKRIKWEEIEELWENRARRGLVVRQLALNVNILGRRR